MQNFTQSSFYTADTFSHRSLYAEKTYAQQFLHTDGLYTKNYPHRSLTHRRFYAQHFLHTHSADVFTQTQIAHRNLCTQHAFNTANFCTERLCFPFLITYLSCSPSQISSTLHSTSCLNQATLCEVASKSQPQVGVTLEDLWSALCLGCLKQRKQRKHTNTPRHEMTWNHETQKWIWSLEVSQRLDSKTWYQGDADARTWGRWETWRWCELWRPPSELSLHHISQPHSCLQCLTYILVRLCETQHINMWSQHKFFRPKLRKQRAWESSSERHCWRPKPIATTDITTWVTVSHTDITWVKIWNMTDMTFCAKQHRSAQTSTAQVVHSETLTLVSYLMLHLSRYFDTVDAKGISMCYSWCNTSSELFDSWGRHPVTAKRHPHQAVAKHGTWHPKLSFW